ncbi:unnamed protein product, partial [Linum tenue]
GSTTTRAREVRFVELYSLRNDSWKIIEDDTDRSLRRLPLLPYSQQPPCYKGKLYWWGADAYPRDEATRFVTFDLSREVFQRAEEVRNPADRPWTIGSLFVPSDDKEEDSLVAICVADPKCESLEIWAMLKLWVPESWIKLFTIDVATAFYSFQGISRNSLVYYCYKKDVPFLVVYHLGSGERIELDMSSTGRIHEVLNYVPSLVSLT